MLQVKLIVIGLFIMSIGTAIAWTDEVAPVGNETLNLGFNPALNETTADIPYLYGMDIDVMNQPLLMSSYLSNDAVTVCTTYTLYKQIWNGTDYEQIINCNISIDSCVDLIYNPSKDAYELPPNFQQVTTNGFLIKKYFQELINSDSEYCSQWNSTDDIDFPDVMYTTIEIDVNDGNTYEAYMYTALDGDDVETLQSGDIDYGFALDGRGSGGSSGSIYEGIDMYGSSDSDTSGMAAGFNTIFWCIIPLIFILAVMKLSSRVMK